MNDLFIRWMELPEPVPRESYLNDLPVVRSLAKEKIEFHKRVTFFVGENGSGKSTLIEALAVALGFNPEGGSRNFNFSTQETHSELCDYVRVARGVIRNRTGFFLRAESYYNFASNLDKLEEDDEGDYSDCPLIARYGSRSLHKQSHGESFLALVENRFYPNGLYILDEPEAALSPSGIIRLIRNIDRLIHRNCQFIIATHSPMLITFPDAEVYQIGEDGIRSVRFQDTVHYRTTVRFLQNPESAMEEITGEGKTSRMSKE